MPNSKVKVKVKRGRGRAASLRFVGLVFNQIF